ncbi:four helix bundle protein [Hymenobacter properus]|uniref:Four helix bundle protein n=1 Tax=Hymenobacter properus TaxID=2791026 RepID=A0A931BE58_9BACT|nr:four helix bundle protein [Hymenobacter properus]MBF9140021.1 four helix bundle protein [Hymenobacter properus]MBR7718828.1 four helix bundle protein [Microvirga sp. SRT04]
MERSYTELSVWLQSRQLTKRVYELTQHFPKEELFGLTNQLRRAAVSVPSNIAEGCGRQHTRDTLQFLFVARGSLFEVETQLYLANDLAYLTEAELQELLSAVTNCKKLLQGFIRYYRSLLPVSQVTEESLHYFPDNGQLTTDN